MLSSKNSWLLLAAALLVPAFYVDGRVVDFVRSFNTADTEFSRAARAVHDVISTVSHGSVLLLLSFLIYAAGRYFRNRGAILGRDLIVGFLVSGAAVQILKRLAGRARPRITDHVMFIGPTLQIDYDSFPSGHTTSAFCLAYLASYHFPRHRPFFFTLAALIGIDRIYGMSHFPADVLAGALLGLIIGRVLTDTILKDKSTPAG